jgi:hypothetical protein
MRSTTRIAVGLVALVLLAVAAYAAAAATPAKDTAAAPMHTVIQADATQWGPAPPILPAGAKLAVLQGDPGKDGEYAIRLSMPDGYVVAPHWHPTAENVTVVSGTFHIAGGDSVDKSKGDALTAGGFVSLPAQMHHYAWAEGATVVQVHGMGPFQLTYVNPADDPSAKKP